MSTIFIAVKCFQCATMQVKQQRKSGNKWICAVCNEKQSVQKVFARAPMAKDVRKFVQSFNMSRRYEDEHSRVDEILDGGIVGGNQLAYDARKRRSDWSEYLDLEEDGSQKGRGNEREIGNDFVEGEIVTEFPDVKSKKSKFKSHSSWPEGGEGDRSSRPIFSNIKCFTNHSSSQDEIRNLESAAAIHGSKRSKSVPEDDEKASTKTCIIEKVRGPSSKWWSEYITEEDNCRSRNEENMVTKQNNMDILKTMTNDEMVEDDVHPDFK